MYGNIDEILKRRRRRVNGIFADNWRNGPKFGDRRYSIRYTYYIASYSEQPSNICARFRKCRLSLFQTTDSARYSLLLVDCNVCRSTRIMYARARACVYGCFSE